MPTTCSPLRYPGGKTALWRTVAGMLKRERLEGCRYVEPYAGGAGLALRLLFEGLVCEVHINDLDRSVHAFWDSALHETDALCRLIESTPVTMEQWHRQRQVQSDHRFSTLNLGFSTLFLNRVNHSGILTGGVIGGKSQSGRWRMGERYRKPALIEKVRRVAEFRNHIHLHNLDAERLMRTLDHGREQRTLFFIDPPYFCRGASLYANHYHPKDHESVAKTVRGLRCPWLLTYDDCTEIEQLYSDLGPRRYRLNYSAQNRRRGTELMVVGPGLAFPDILSPLSAA